MIAEEAERKVETILAVRETLVVEASLAAGETEVSGVETGAAETAGVEVEMETGARVVVETGAGMETGEKSSSKSLTSCLNFFLKVLVANCFTDWLIFTGVFSLTLPWSNFFKALVSDGSV